MTKYITAAELAAKLVPYGDMPVKLRVDDPEDFAYGADCICSTILTPENTSIFSKAVSETDWGDLPRVCFIDVNPEDNA